MAQVKKRQKFFNIKIPLIGKEVQLYGYELENFQNRTIIYDLTRILRGKGMVLKVKVNVKGEKATSRPKELKVMPYFIRRMMRKGTNYVEDSFSAECKNGTLKIKPFLLTRKKVSRAIRKALREKAREELINYIKKKSINEIFDEIMNNRLQKTLGLRLKKIYPLSLCEIKTITLEKETEAPEEMLKEENIKSQTIAETIEKEKQSEVKKIKKAPAKKTATKKKVEKEDI